MHRFAAIARLLVLPALLGGCGASTSWILSPEGCTDKEMVDAVLHVDPSDDRWLWGVDRTTGTDISLRVPGGYGETVDEPPTLITPSGARSVGPAITSSAAAATSSRTR